MDVKKLMWDVGCGELTEGLTAYSVTQAQLENLISKVTEEAVARVTAERDALRKALGCGIVICQALHHDKKDQHGIGEPCPVEQRVKAALEQTK